MMHPLDVVGFTRGCTPDNPAGWGQWRANQWSVWRALRELCCPILTAAFPMVSFADGAEGFGMGKVFRLYTSNDPYLHSLKSERRFDCFPFASNLAQTASKLNGKLSPNSGKLGIDNPVA